MDKRDFRKRLLDAGIPPHVVGGLVRYVTHGKPTGGFLKAVLENNLMGSFARADDVNREAMYQIVVAVHNITPSGCHGSHEKVAAWIAKGGLTGLDNLSEIRGSYGTKHSHHNVQ